MAHRLTVACPSVYLHNRLGFPLAFPFLKNAHFLLPEVEG